MPIDTFSDGSFAPAQSGPQACVLKCHLSLPNCHCSMTVFLAQIQHYIFMCASNQRDKLLSFAKLCGHVYAAISLAQYPLRKWRDDGANSGCKWSAIKGANSSHDSFFVNLIINFFTFWEGTAFPNMGTLATRASSCFRALSFHIERVQHRK